ncbi:MAG: cytochrome c-type biosis protein DsbD protein-disulfide reductase [Pseudonocardiales bacterium]|nr:cytochrome c-type biosis protein DsbD protein-disulfide reductase [Pseudonocardiales bacterium]
MTVFWVLCIQVVIVCVWRLLSLVAKNRIFTAASLGWVDSIVWAIAAAWVTLVAVFLYVGFRADDPGLPLLLFLMSVGLAVLGLLMVVLRTMLRNVTELRADMDAVI